MMSRSTKRQNIERIRKTVDTDRHNFCAAPLFYLDRGIKLFSTAILYPQNRRYEAKIWPCTISALSEKVTTLFSSII